VLLAGLCAVSAIGPTGAAADGPSISFRAPAAAERGASILAQGRVAGLDGRASLRAQLLANGGWRTIARRAAGNGRFRLSLRLPADAGTAKLRSVIVVGGRQVAASAVVRVRLAQPKPAPAPTPPSPSAAAQQASASASSAPPPPEPESTPVTPSDSLYWGAWIDPGTSAQPSPVEPARIANFESIAGKPLSLLESFSAFAECSTCSFIPFPSQQLNAIRARGAVPLFTWASEATSGEVSQPEFQLADLIDGSYDAEIRKWATAARNWAHPFFLRFDWEMNGNWYPWAEGVNGNTAGEYVEAWRHVHDVFTEVGATNASWVWCPYVNPNGNLQPIANLYPGDEYVDWTCLDGYNYGTSKPTTKWRSFSYLFSPQYAEITGTIAPSKPMLIAEVASAEQGGSKAAWITEMLSELPTGFPDVRGVMWFDYFYEGNEWALESSSEAEQAFAAGIADPRYLTNQFGGLAANPIPTP
jgi:hypothetical protein